MDWPGNNPALPAPVNFLTSGKQNLGAWAWYAGTNTVTAAGTWPSALLLIHQGVIIPAPITINRLSWTVVTQAGNVNAGIFDADANGLPRNAVGAPIGSTAVAAAGVQVAAFPSPITIDKPGIYYVSFACSLNTASFQRLNPSTSIGRTWGLQSETLGAIGTWPTTATPANMTTNYAPIIGVHGLSVA